MTPLVISLVIVVVVVIVALAATNPVMRKREDAAIKAVKESLGDDGYVLLEPRTTAMGTDPEEAGGIRGMACLACSATDLVAITWVGGNEWRIPRAAVVAVDTPADDPTAVQKATITITYRRADGQGDATAMYRVRDAADWLTELGYDWGDEGPPVVVDDTDVAVGIDDGAGDVDAGVESSGVESSGDDEGRG